MPAWWALHSVYRGMSWAAAGVAAGIVHLLGMLLLPEMTLPPLAAVPERSYLEIGLLDDVFSSTEPLLPVALPTVLEAEGEVPSEVAAVRADGGEGQARVAEPSREEIALLALPQQDEQIRRHAEASLLKRVGGRISKRIQSAWKVPYSTPLGVRARIRVHLGRRGEVNALEFLEPSSSDSFNNSVIRTLRGIGNFPVVGTLPEDLYREQFQELVLVFDAEAKRRL